MPNNPFDRRKEDEAWRVEKDRNGLGDKGAKVGGEKKTFELLLQTGNFAQAREFFRTCAIEGLIVTLDRGLLDLAVQQGYVEILKKRGAIPWGDRWEGIIPVWDEEPLLSASRQRLLESMREVKLPDVQLLMHHFAYANVKKIFFGLEQDVQQYYKQIWIKSGADALGAIRVCDNHATSNRIAPDYKDKLRGVVQGAYERLLRAGQVDTVGEVCLLTGVQPDVEKLKEPLLAITKALLEKENWLALQNLHVYVGVSKDGYKQLLPTCLQIAKKMLAQARLDGLLALKQEMQFELEFVGKREQQLQQAYAQWMKDPERLRKLKQEIVPGLGVEPDFSGVLNGAMPGIYETLLKLPRQKVEGVKPKRRRRPARRMAPPEHPPRGRAFEEMLGEKMTPFEFLAHWSLVEPDWEGSFYETAKKASVMYLREQRPVELGKLWDEAVGIKVRLLSEPEIQRAIQEGYAAAIRDGRRRTIQEIEELTETKPDWHAHSQALQKLYKRWLQRGDVNGVADMERRSGIGPDYAVATDAIQKRYADWIRRKKFDSVDAMERLTGIVPDPVRLDAEIQSVLAELIVREEYVSARVFADRYHAAFDRAKAWQPLLFHGYYHVSNIQYLEERLGRVMDVWADRPDAIAGIKAAAKEAFPRMLMSQTYGYVGICIKRLGVRPEAESMYKAIMDEIGRGVFPPDLMQLCLQCRIRMELTTEQAKTFANASPRALAFVVRLWLPKDAKKRQEVLNILFRGGAWRTLVPELLDIRGLAMNEKYCPWTQLNELIPRLGNQGIRFDNEGERSGFMSYIRRFGMQNLPELAMTWIRLESYRDALLRGDKQAGQDARSKIPMAHLQAFWRIATKSDESLALETPQDVERCLQAIVRVMDDMRDRVLRDETPEGIAESPLHLELFNALFPKTGRYGDLLDRAQILKQWEAVVRKAGAEGKPESVSVKGGYETRSYAFRTATPDVSLEDLLRQMETMEDDPELLAKRAQALEKLRERVNRAEAREEYQKFFQPMNAVAAGWAGVGEGKTSGEPNVVFRSLISSLEEEIRRAKEQLQEFDPDLEAKKYHGVQRSLELSEERLEAVRPLANWKGIKKLIEEEEKRLRAQKEEAVIELGRVEFEAVDPEKTGKIQGKIQAFKGRIEHLENLEKQMRQLGSDDATTYGQWQRMAEALRIALGKGSAKVAPEELRRIILELMRLESPGHADAVADALKQSGGRMDAKVREAWAKWFEEELLLHFAFPEQAHGEIRIIPFSPDLQVLIENLWRITNIRKPLLKALQGQAAGGGKEKVPKHSFTDVLFEVRAAEEEIDLMLHPKKAKPKTMETQTVTFHPLHGVGRIFAGDVGNACHTSQRGELAKNAFPDLEAVMFSRETAGRMEVIGNVLLIEAKTLDGKKAVVIRALNPTEAVLKGDLMLEDFVSKTVEYAISVAEKRGLDEVRICNSPARVHSTNRDEIADAIQVSIKKHRWPLGTALENKPETRFNNHAIWRAGETSTVWRRG